MKKTFITIGMLCLGLCLGILATGMVGFGWAFLAAFGSLGLAFPGRE